MKSLFVFLGFTLGVFGVLYSSFLNSPHTIEGGVPSAMLFTFILVIPMYLAARMTWKYWEFIGMTLFLVLTMSGFAYLLDLVSGTPHSFLEILKPFANLMVPLAFIMVIVKAIHGNPITSDSPSSEDFEDSTLVEV